MGRPRKKDTHLPPCVHYRHGAYWYVKEGRWTRLAKDLSSALVAYARRHETSPGKFSSLVDSCLTSMRPTLSRGSWKQYQMAARKLKHTLGHFEPAQIDSAHVAEVKMMLKDTPNVANLCLNVLSQVFNYAVEMQLVRSNPVTGIRRLKEGKRKRLITREEYDRIYANCNPQLQCIMDLLYLTGQRPVDVLTLRASNLQSGGIFFHQQKTGASLVVRWTEELRTVTERAKSLRGNVRALTLFHSSRGKPPHPEVIQQQFRRACDAAGVEDAQMRDIRAMSGTAARQQGLDPTKLLGHKNKEMTERYLRDRISPVVDGPSFGHVQNLQVKPKKK